MMLEAEERGEERGREYAKEQINRINKLHALLIHEKRYEDLEHSTRDKEFQWKLMQQYNI